MISQVRSHIEYGRLLARAAPKEALVLAPSRDREGADLREYVIEFLKGRTKLLRNLPGSIAASATLTVGASVVTDDPCHRRTGLHRGAV